MQSSVKLISLSALCVLMTVMTIVMHISRTQRAPGTPSYNPAAAVLLTEVGKLLCAVVLAVREVRAVLLEERQEELEAAASEDDRDFFSSGRDSSRRGSHEGEKEPEKRGLWISMPSDKDHDDAASQADTEATAMSRQGSSLSVASSSSTLLADAPERERFFPQSPPLAGESSSAPITLSTILRRIKQETTAPGWYMLAVPALLFTCQANLSYFASSRLSVPVFQVTYQLKIPATALCTVLMLKRTLTRTQWLSIVLLTAGVAIVQLASLDADKAHPHADSASKTDTADVAISTTDTSSLESIAPDMAQIWGLVAVCLACLSSGFSGVFFERVLKAAPKPTPPEDTEFSSNHATYSPPRKTGLWIRNIQLSIFSLSVSAVIYVCTADSAPSASSAGGLLGSFLLGFTPIVYFLVCLQIAGGLLAAVVIQYADNIAKSFSASCSIILSFAASMYLFDYTLSPGVVVGGAAVIASTWLFNASGEKPSSPSMRPILPANGRLPVSPKPAQGDYILLRTGDVQRQRQSLA